VSGLPLVFATVGTDVHPFHRMTRWIDTWLEDGGADLATCFMQTGTSCEPRLATHDAYLGYFEMEDKMREAAAVVCHGGPGTIMLCVSLGKRPIVVPRMADRGEHVDNHQRAFSRRIASDGAILLAETEEQFRTHVDGVLGGNVEPFHRLNGQDPSAAAARFEELVNRLVGTPRQPDAPRRMRGKHA
jgi:UDP-N-acetylglucosamine transferase subunit ALG13